MRRIPVLAVVVTTLLAFTPQQQEAPPLWGFAAASARAQREMEARYDGMLRPDDLRGWMRELTDKPFYVGSPGDEENAEFLAGLFRSWGFETRVETYQVLFPLPTTRLLEMTAPVRFTASLAEPVLDEDGTSGVAGRLPTYNAYSADGDVEGELVYVNYGIPDDYEELARRGIDVAGKIVIARYGGSWRGIKPKVAAEHGAIGCILYSDPRDDGYFQGDVYPEGAYRMSEGVQRGSVEDMPQYPGDPLTPGVAATEDAERYTVEESPVIMKIPVLPISYADAQPLLEQLEGPVAPASWRGALPITYHVGPGPARVHLQLAFDWSLKPARDIIAVLPGTDLPDEWVVRGNHRDGWAMGAGDPISGLVGLLAEARAVGELAQAGVRPRRTIVYAAWDAEEPGLLGSTEWVEDHADELRAKAVAYINSDGNSRGFLGIGGSHILERFANQLGVGVPDPQTDVTVDERRRARAAVGGEADALTRTDLTISPLGSGSDYTPFLQHLGIPSLNIGFGGEGGGGSYHSQFDSFDHFVRFGDPTFEYGVALAKVAGRATLRLANADVIPYRFTNFADRVSEYADEVQELADHMRTETATRNRLLDAGAYTVTADPTETWFPPERQAAVPYLNFAPVENAQASLQEAAKAYDQALAAALAGGGLTAGRQQRLNGMLLQAERLMTREGGLPRRPWFRHMIYAPGFYTGYGVKTLPGIREGIEERHFDEVATYVDEVAAALDRVTALVRRATGVVKGS